MALKRGEGASKNDASVELASAIALQCNRVMIISAAPKHTPHRVVALPPWLKRASIGQFVPDLISRGEAIRALLFCKDSGNSE